MLLKIFQISATTMLVYGEICVVVFQEDLQMRVKGGKYQLMGMVSLGDFYVSMKKIESRQ